MSHVRDITGVPAAIVPDQLKSGVMRSCRYEPGLQRTYAELAQHYATAIIPARPAHPKDKGGRSTIFTSQLDAKRYHEYLNEPTVGDAVCDRLIHNAHRVVLSGPSRRKEESSTK